MVDVLPAIKHLSRTSMKSQICLKRSLEKKPQEQPSLAMSRQARELTLSALSSSLVLARIPTVASALMQRQLILHVTIPAAVRFWHNV